MSYFAGIDCGTQGSKVIIYDAHSHNVLGLGHSPHHLISETDGRSEQHPQWWIDAVTTAFKLALQKSTIDAQAIKGIGVSGQQHGLVVLDEQDRVIRPAKLWNDTSTHVENEQLIKALGGKQSVIDRIGLMIATGYTASKLLWLKQHEPQNFVRIRSILLPHDYLNFWLTGDKTADYGDASGTGFFDIRQRNWSEEVLAKIDDSGMLPRALPRLIKAQQPAGQLTVKAAEQLGLKPGITVSSGGGDNMMGAIGTGNVSSGKITMSMGTSGTLYAQMDAPCIDEQGLIAGFCSSTNAWLPLVCTMNVTNVTSTVQDFLNMDLGRFNNSLDQSTLGADGLIMLPFLNGERTPDLPEVRASLIGINTQNLTHKNLCRAAVEGASFGLRYGLDLFRAKGLNAEQISLVGGGAKSPAWRQIIADMMNSPVVVPTEPEAAALGAALQAQWCHARETGEELSLAEICANGVKTSAELSCEPSASNTQRYDEVYEKYRDYRYKIYLQ